MRILHFIPSLSSAVGGPARAVIDLCKALAARDHEVTLLTSDAGQAPQSWQNAADKLPRIVVLPSASLPGFTYLGSALRTFDLSVQSHDVLHVHGMWEFANIQLCGIASAHCKPYAISVHGMLDPWSMSQGTLKKRVYLEMVGKKWLRAASRIHLTVQSELDAGSKFFPRKLGRVVPLLVDLESYRRLPGPGLANAKLEERCGEHAGKPRILFLSRLHPKKGLETLLQSARLLASRNRAVSIVVAGDGDAAYVAQLKSEARDLGESVIFLGETTGELKLSLYQACDVFALPTQQENFGLVFIEALGCGLPVITTNAVGSKAELQASGAVTFVDRTPEQFADAIERLLLDAPGRMETARRGREWMLESFDPAISAQRFESFYAEMLADQQAKSNRPPCPILVSA